MGFSFVQRPNHLEVSGTSLVAHWRATGSTNNLYVERFAQVATPSIATTLNGVLHRQQTTLQQSGYNQFDVDVTYGQRKNEIGEWTFDYDTTGGTVHISNSKETVSRYPQNDPAQDGDAPDMKGAIGVDGDQVKGVPIVIPVMKVNVTYKHPQGVITMDRAMFLASITGTVSSTPIFGRPAGEVLFLGSRGSDGTTAPATATYQFAISPNVSGMTVGSIADIVKAGHDVAWISYKDDTDTTGTTKKAVRVPQYVYIERVYDRIDLANALGFGG